MAFENKELCGALFKNENKNPGSKQPDFTGSIKIEGVDYRLAGWLTTSRGGVDYISLKATDPEEQQQYQNRQGNADPAGSFMGTSQREATSGDSYFEKERARVREIAERARVKPRPSLSDDFTDDDIPF